MSKKILTLIELAKKYSIKDRCSLYIQNLLETRKKALKAEFPDRQCFPFVTGILRQNFYQKTLHKKIKNIHAGLKFLSL